MKIIIKNVLSPWYYSLYGHPLKDKVRSFWRRGWIHAPETMASSILAMVGLTFYFYKVFTADFDDETEKYRNYPTVYRPTDPAVKKIKHTCKWD